MMIDKKIWDIICEPVTGENLWLDSNILKSGLGREYEIIDGISSLVNILDKKMHIL